MPERVESGDPLEIDADTWNILAEFAASEQARRDGRAGGLGVGDSVRAGWRVKVRNSSGASRAPLEVLTVSTALCQPDDGSVGWMRRPVLDAVLPVAGYPACVLLDGAVVDEVVTAVLGGLAVVNLDVVSTGHLWADVIVGDAAKLRSGTSGPARVLWKQSGGTGVTLAVVLLSSGVGATITVKDSTGSPSYAGIGTLEIVAANLTLTNPSTGVARLAASGGGGSLTAQDSTGTPSYTSITTLQVVATNGLVLTNPSAGVARIDITAATASVPGVVTTGGQTFAGNKEFTGLTRFSNTVTIGSTTHLYQGQLLSIDASGIRWASSRSGQNLYITLVPDSYRVVLECDSLSSYPAIRLLSGAGTRDGLTTTVGYNKSAGGTGTLTFTSGLLTAST